MRRKGSTSTLCYRCKLVEGTSRRNWRKNGTPLLICKPCRNIEFATWRAGYRGHRLHYTKDTVVWGKNSTLILNKLSLRAKGTM